MYFSYNYTYEAHIIINYSISHDSMYKNKFIYVTIYYYFNA